MKFIQLLSPAAAPEIPERSDIAPRLVKLDGARIGVLYNNRPNADVLLRACVEEIVATTSAQLTTWRTKRHVGVPEPDLDMFEDCDLVLVAAADIGAAMSWTVRDAVRLERSGTPTALIACTEVITECRFTLAAEGLPGLPVVVVPALSQLPQDEVVGLAEAVVRDIFEVLTDPVDNLVAAALADAARSAPRPGPEYLSVSNDIDGVTEANAEFYARGWADGLPIGLPTPKYVAELVACSSYPADHVLGVLPPRYGLATVEKVAVNAAIAGCRPAHFPAVVAAVQATSAEEFMLESIQTTTNPCTPLLIVNGPWAEATGMNSGANVLGQGNIANAAIGRALRLCLTNIGGAVPEKVDRATQGMPGKYSYCMAENEGANPWSPLHVELGFQTSDSTVTVIAAEAPHNINEHVHGSAHGIVRTVADSMAASAGNNIHHHGSEVVVVLCPYHARRIRADGWTKDDVRRFLYENARKPMAAVRDRGSFVKFWDRWIEDGDSDSLVPITADWRDILVVVAGGSGKHSCWIPTFGVSRAATALIAL
ncbi:UGSC family (seleno)protein [Actinophytocola sp.]|uniref:UGSC family (seleno)protein n=1 Tax=Actinophytocola sp. TaxID=1872138 RepID=UPI003D6B2ED1